MDYASSSKFYSGRGIQTTDPLHYNWVPSAANSINLGIKPSAAAVSSGGDFLVIGEADQVERWSFLAPNNPQKLQAGVLGENDVVRSVAVSQDGKLFAAGGHDATVWVFDGDSGKPLATYKAQGIPFRLMFDPDSRYLVAAVGNDRKDVGRTLSLYDEGSKIQFWMLPPRHPSPSKRPAAKK